MDTASVDIVNLLPHPLTIYKDGVKLFYVCGSGEIARREEKVTPDKEMMRFRSWAFPTATVCYGPVVGMPEPRPNTIFVVSRVTAAAVPSRTDLYFPYREVRDDKGTIVGCEGLGRFTSDD